MNKDSALSSKAVDPDNEYEGDDFEKDDIVQIAEPQKPSIQSKGTKISSERRL